MCYSDEFDWNFFAFTQINYSFKGRMIVSEKEFPNPSPKIVLAKHLFYIITSKAIRGVKATDGRGNPFSKHSR
jgi:hypothetical protein